MNIPNPHISVIEDEDGVVTFRVLSWGNTEQIRVYGGRDDEQVEITGDIADALTLRGASKYSIVAVGTDGKETVVQTYTPQTETNSAFRVVNDDSMTIEKATERYASGKTWILELENELEMAMD